MFISFLMARKSRKLTDSVKLKNIDRGTHTLRAEVEDSNGNVLISTTAVRFTPQRYFCLF